MIVPSLDLFCRIVDNFGDIGVTWRLLRQIRADYPDIAVRLIVDDMPVFKRIETSVDPSLDIQTVNGITILRWDDAVLLQQYGQPAAAVIEAFACELPDFVVKKMQQKSVSPVWIDLEYLSAEDWVEGCHAVPSLHPSTGLMKTLFFPGFTARTGGLTREASLIEERSAFQAQETVQTQWRAARGIPAKEDGVLDISLFCYGDAPLSHLIEDLADQPVRLLVPPGVLTEQIADLKGSALLPGESWQTGSLILYGIPFLPQPDYDRLLWTCDANFVRGEDSWIRALWAAKPFIWLAYPQERGASMTKLQAFLARYTEGLAPEDAESLADLHTMWNLGGRDGTAGPRSWRELVARLPVLDHHAFAWTARQAGQTDLATSLIRFIAAQTQTQILKAAG